MTSYLGIDPGLSGGFVLISDDKIVWKMVMPTLSHKTEAGKTKKEIDRDGVLSFLATIPPFTHVAIEEQIPVRNQHIQASHTLAKNYGILLMGLTAIQMKYIEVPSDVWQAMFGIVSVKKAGGKTTKEQAFDIAQMIYPNEDFRKSDRTHTIHTGIVDATLIAKYCQSLYVSTPDVIEPLEEKHTPDVPGTIKPLDCKPGGNQPGTKLERRLF